jgi:hypothetical protein
MSTASRAVAEKRHESPGCRRGVRGSDRPSPSLFTRKDHGGMARKVVNRKELRAQADAAEAAAKSKKEKPAKDKPAKEKKAKAEKAPKPAAKKPSRKKVVKDVRMKAYWGVFNQAMKRLAMFEYADKKAAEKKAAELGANHFIQLVKEAITE